MNQYQEAKQFGASLILFTALFRVFEIGLPQNMIQKWKPQSVPIETETGRDVRSFHVSRRALLPDIPELPPPTVPPEPPKLPAFQPEEADGIAFTDTAKQKYDAAALIASELDFHLAGAKPTVLIFHTHTTESYTRNGEDYRESSAYRTLDEGYNMLSVGDRVAEILEAAGVHVIHDRELHDYPSYNGAYTHARKSVRAILEDNPGIQLVLDLHRDAVEGKQGQLRTAVSLGSRSSAKLMFVLGCGNSNLSHPKWRDNLALALKLQATLEKQAPGICRPISLRPQRFNQDLSTGALLVEIGAAGNTHDEAILAAEQLANAILTLKDGAAPGEIAAD